ncbi:MULTISPECIES: right-handed parallel beta-helix repeat-containing protein [Lacticaseibacillus]|uniref:Right-handed parallel beta-helix repeat-containing protein n=2 Tax=Lacticaseibacillus TaxID=2759736 RepID=A0AAN1F0N9_LACCA|nr:MULTISPECIES: right-handed parallel beta-helix repeat-containing protein [Lacticaseibacillus]ARY92660.1 serine protease [Lacticaseibacillus casei]KAB1969499.1 right-handed parallel beta-helix repeat-containing protein [Lacticaseibacillus casei]WLV80560.1 right-handed parallel beta-helix repeat-containing protein [Lacticaseibacillus sp. NCIMB 15473]WNX24521.1 right-handed parallel beta-helix repeat-containing protein [Lacticaseibacillus casei]WNX27293.1 right-handed parallel beta-helix repea
MKRWRVTQGKVWVFLVALLGLAVMINGQAPQRSLAAGPRTFYVANNGSDSHDGLSADQPWQSLEKVAATKFQPGDRILFDANSVWNGQLLLDGAKNGEGTSAAPITIGSYNQGSTGKKAIINGLGTTANKNPYHERKLSNLNLMTGTVELWNANHWTISDLEVTNTAGDGNRQGMRIGILVASDIQTAYPRGNDAAAVQQKLAIFKASHRTGITITNNNVHNVDGAYQSDLIPDQTGKMVAAGKNSGGIIIVGNTDVTATHNVITDVANEGLRNDANASVLPGGWDQYSFQASAKTIFRHNYIRNSAGDGIVISSSENGTAEYNTVQAANSMPNSKNAAGASKNFAGLWFMGGEYNLAQYNEVFDIPNHYLDGAAFDFDGFASKGVYQYNYSHDNSGGFTLFMGDHQTDNVFRYNLSVNDVKDVPLPALNHLIFVVSGKADGIDGFPLFNNNTFIVGKAVKNLMISNNGQTGIRFVNNLVYAPGGNVPRFVVNQNGTKRPVFTEGRLDHNLFYPQALMDESHAGTVDVSGNIFADPQLVDAGAKPSGLIQQVDGTFDRTALAAFVPQAKSPAANAGVNVDELTPAAVKEKFPIRQDFAGKAIDFQHPTIGAFEAAKAVPVVQKDDLKTLIDQALDAKKTDRYSLASVAKKQAFDQALQEAQRILADSQANQSAVDQAVKALQAVLDQLDGHQAAEASSASQEVSSGQKTGDDKKSKQDHEDQSLPQAGDLIFKSLPIIGGVILMSVVIGGLYFKHVREK